MLKTISGNAFRLSPDASVVLDIIRIFAAQAVLVGHSLSFLQIFPHLQPPYAPYMQNIGVLIFFVLSGLLISYSVRSRLDNGEYLFVHFLVDRFSRIYSALVPCLTLVALFDLYQIYYLGSYEYDKSFSVIKFFGSLLLVGPFGSARPLWTLIIEWWLYMFYGWFVINAIQTRNWNVKRIAILIALSIIPVWNLVGGRGNGLTAVWYMGVLITFLLSSISLFQVRRRYAFMLSVFSIIMAMVRIQFLDESHNAYELNFALLLAMALFFLIHGLKDSKIVLNHPQFRKCVTFLSDYSFTLYLLHYTVISVLVYWRGTISSYVLFIFSLIICNLFASLIAYFTEMRHKEFNVYIKKRLSL